MEEWRDIPGYEGLYQISSLGRVKSLAREIPRPTGNGPLRLKEKLLKTSPGNHGYPVVNLCRDKKVTQRLVHQLIAEAFIGPCPPGQEVRHRDGVRTHCTLGNLTYGTRLQNIIDAQEHGTFIKGSKVGGSKLTLEEAREVKRRLAGGEGVMILAREFGLSHTSIINIRNGRNWGWLT